VLYPEFDYDKAFSKLHQIVKNIEVRFPSAAVSLKEGMGRDVNPFIV
jgi:hypothetical protein